MDRMPATGVTVTFTPVHHGEYLFVQRLSDDPVLGGYWCFPGGKLEIGETVATAIERECKEETALSLTSRIFFVDSYLLGKRLGLHFAVEVTSSHVKLDELQDHAWVKAVEDLGRFNPRIPGIDTHLHYIIAHLKSFEGIGPDLAWSSLEQFDLVEHRFLNR